MAKIKLSKTELKGQRDALARYKRFLPTLELKKEQLIVELRRIEHQAEECTAKETGLRDALAKWVKLFSEPVGIEKMVRLTDIITSHANIAGVNIPVFLRAEFDTSDYDLFETPLWVDSAVDMIQNLAAIQAEREIILQQRELLHHEMRITIQRINLFDKVKIPECKENVRKINIFLGDQQANAVARGKIAKNKINASAD